MFKIVTAVIVNEIFILGSGVMIISSMTGVFWPSILPISVACMDILNISLYTAV